MWTDRGGVLVGVMVRQMSTVATDQPGLVFSKTRNGELPAWITDGDQRDIVKRVSEIRRSAIGGRVDELIVDVIDLSESGTSCCHAAAA